MADDALAHHRPVPSRRAVLSTAAWTAPALVSTFVPAAAQSTRTASVEKVRIAPDYTVVDQRQYDPVTGSNRGPLMVYVSALYDQNVTWWPTPDPDRVLVSYLVEVSGPLGPKRIGGQLEIMRGGYAQQLIWYPGKKEYPLPPGEYGITLTIYGADGSKSAVRTIVIA